MSILRGARSLFAAAMVGVAWMLVTFFLRLVVIPGAWLFPAARLRLISWDMKAISWSTFTVLRIGGGRFRRRGRIPTGSPVYIVANHQAILDVMQVCLLSHPYAPSFVTRTRYQRWIPHVSACLRLQRCPMVDPRKDPRGAIEAIRRGARELTHGLLIYPEGHRTKNGDVGPFRPAGLQAMLQERRHPVYVVVNDGMWKARRFSDAIFRAHLMDGWSEAFGPFEPPADDAEIPAFIEGLRDTLVERLAEHRAGVGAGASSSAGHGPAPEPAVEEDGAR